VESEDTRPSSYRRRSAFKLLTQCLDIIRRHERPILGTLTFQDHISDKAEAAKRFRRFIERVRRRAKAEGWDLEMAGCWELQKRGVWHPHFIASMRLEVSWLRPIAQACGFGAQMDLQYIKPVPGFRNVSQEQAARYVCKYVVKDCGNPALRGKRLPIYFNTRRVCSNRFEWSGGLRRLFRLGAVRQFGHEADYKWDERDLVKGLPRMWSAESQCYMSEGERWRQLVLIGLNSFPEGVQAAMIEASPGLHSFLVGEGLINAPF
jgi:hypothetical protein